MTTTGAQTSYAGLNAVLERARRQPSTSTSISEGQLVALQTRWTRSLSARLDRSFVSRNLGLDQAIEFASPGPPVEMFADAWW